MTEKQKQIDKLLKETQEMLRFTSWWDKLKFRIKYLFIRIKNYE